MTEGEEQAALFEWPGLGGDVAATVDVARLVEIERAAVSVLEPVTRLWRELATSTDAAISQQSIDAVLRASLQTMARLLSVNTVAVLLANDAGDELVARVAIGLSEELTLDLGIRAGQGMAGRVLASCAPLLVRDLSAIEVVSPVLRNSGLRSVAAVPLLSGDQALGVLYAASYELDRFTAADTALLGVAAERLATALDRVRLFERERAARRRAERLAERIGRMQGVTSRLASARTTTEVAAALCDALRDGPWQWCEIWLRHDDRLMREASSAPSGGGRTPAAPAAGTEPVSPPAGPDTVRIDEPSLLASVLTAREPHESRGEHGVTLFVPLAAGRGAAGELVAGVLVAGAGSEPGPDDRELLATAVEQAALAFERASLATDQQRSVERATFFARAAQVLAEADDLGSTLDRLAELAVSALGEICFVDVVTEDGRVTRLAARHRDPRRQPDIDRLRTEFPPDPGGAHPGVRAIREGRSSWRPEMPDDFLSATTVNAAHLELVRSLDFRSYLSVPLRSGGHVVGSVTSVSTSRAFRRDDIAFAEQLARHVAAVVENARRHDSAFRTSQILQSSLLPETLPEVPGLSVETRYLTANRGIEVGGDFYDLAVLPSGQVLVVIGDVAGHDRAAAAGMGRLRSAARVLAARSGTATGLLSGLRSSWELLGLERFATMAVGFLDLSSGQLELASAGHYPPLLLRPEGAHFLPVPPAPPLGVTLVARRAPSVAPAETPARPAAEPDAGAGSWRGRLAPGDVLLCYTDGAIDERGTGPEASMRRLAEVAAGGEHAPAAVCDRVVELLGPHRSDDAALLAVSVDA